MEKVIVGMSGGVDSSVTAYLLKNQGYEVEGLSFILYEEKSLTGCVPCHSPQSTCPHQSIQEASKAASHIRISHAIIDIRKDFLKKVIHPFINAYIKGSTPNPCVLCNRFIKFPFLLKEAEKRGAAYIATGHYARVQSAKSRARGAGRFLLKKGGDRKKDQSYVLYVLTQKELKRIILPLGSYRKDDVRAKALELNLPQAKGSESQEICFIKDQNYSRFIERFTPARGKPGPIVDMSGRVLGTHKGIYGYTIGQRKGLGISSQEPLYVVKIDIVKNTIQVGPQESAKKKEFFVTHVNWIVHPPSVKFRASVKIRSMMKDAQATLYLGSPPAHPFSFTSVSSGDSPRRANPPGCGKSVLGGLSDDLVRVVFDEPQWAPAPGQSAVFYDGDVVIGGGVIIYINEEYKRQK